jgi:cytochrome c oxidase assembly protein subunit 15
MPQQSNFGGRMPKTQNRGVLTWIVTFGSFAVFLVIYGGFVRLTRSGLSIVEWNPVLGAVPPLTQQAWQAEFAKYQTTPEYRQINFDMTIAQYKEIFIVEWLHRTFARLAGLIFAVPFFVFAINRSIPLREMGVYAVMGILFLSQAFLGWIMVSSGLADQPAVSHYLLTAHLFLALALIGLSLWTALGHVYGFPDYSQAAKWSRASLLASAGLVALLVQMAFGGFTAGLKAGHVSDTWPLMLGRLVPQGLLGQVQPAALNLVDAPLTVAFIHRWLALAVLAVALLVYGSVRRGILADELRMGVTLLVALTALQIALGIAVVLSRVEIVLALVHQLNAIGLFGTTVYLLHRLRARDRGVLLLRRSSRVPSSHDRIPSTAIRP